MQDEKVQLSKNKYADAIPAEVRQLIREGRITSQTSGMCEGYAQANLISLPKKYAYDFLLFAMRNPKACPVLEVLEEGEVLIREVANGADIRRDIPKYRVYENGVLTGEYTDVKKYWRDDLVSFLIGCSFSFEEELLKAGIPVRHIEMGCNVPMYLTNIACKKAGVFSGSMVISMRPIPYELVTRAVLITGEMPKVHGAPVHIGDPKAIGIEDINKPDFGDAVEIRDGEIPVFWPCGVTPQAVVMNSKPDFCITHSPGHMFITDIKNVSLKY